MAELLIGVVGDILIDRASLATPSPKSENWWVFAPCGADPYLLGVVRLSLNVAAADSWWYTSPRNVYPGEEVVANASAQKQGDEQGPARGPAYSDRWQKPRRMASQSRLDGLHVASEPNFSWLAGWSFILDAIPSGSHVSYSLFKATQS